MFDMHKRVVPVPAKRVTFKEPAMLNTHLQQQSTHALPSPKRKRQKTDDPAHKANAARKAKELLALWQVTAQQTKDQAAKDQAAKDQAAKDDAVVARYNALKAAELEKDGPRHPRHHESLQTLLLSQCVYLDH